MRNIMDYTEKYVEEPFEGTMVKIRKKTVIRQCEKYKHKVILEVGCGMSPLFLDYKDFDKLIIVDPSEGFTSNALLFAKKRQLADKVVIIKDFLENVVMKIKEAAEHIDFIIVSSLLHEVDEPQLLLKAIRQLSDNDTVIHINVPNARSLHRLIAVSMGMLESIFERSDQQIKMQRKNTYDMLGLKEEVQKAGFIIIDSASYFMKPFSHSQMQKCLDEDIINEKVLEGLENVIEYFPDSGAGIYVNVRRS